jgi:hypothetical protein
MAQLFVIVANSDVISPPCCGAAAGPSPLLVKSGNSRCSLDCNFMAAAHIDLTSKCHVEASRERNREIFDELEI